MITSLGDYSHEGSFGKAFNSAHKEGGNGHTFMYNGKVYNTNCADKVNYGQNKDSYRTAEENYTRSCYHAASSGLYSYLSWLGPKDYEAGRVLMWLNNMKDPVKDS